MELSESLSTREPDLLGELRSAADNLKSCSSPEVQNEIETTVEESVVQWNDSRKSLRNLCERYQNAIKIWTVYRKNSDIVHEWVDNQLSSLSSLPAEQAVQQLQIYEEAVNEQTEKLVELRGMVMEIATEVGVKEDNLLADEIALLSRKLEDVRSAISTLNNVSVFDKRKVVNGELAETQKTLESMKQELSSKGDVKLPLNAEHIQKLNEHLRALAQTDTLLNNINEEQAEILTDPDASDKQKISVVDLLESWQQVFKDTFQQYHGLFSSVSGEQNFVEALKLWTDYLHYIKDFLKSAIPDNYHNLSSDDQICQLYENLLLSQSAILLDEKTKRIGSSLVEQFESLNKLHNETLSEVIARHHQVKQRLLLWQRYQKDQKELLSFLRSIESDQSHLNLRYIYIRTIDSSLGKIEDLLKKIEKGILMADNLSNQHDNLMSGCSQSVITSVKVELDSNYKRLHNSEAALKTWHEYLFKIKGTAKLYEDIASNIEQIFNKVHEGIDNEVCPTKEPTFAIADIKHEIDKLMKYKEEVESLNEEANELTNLEEKLKQSVNPKDMKLVKQRIWLLKQQQSDIKHQLSMLIFELEEKLVLWDTFDKRQRGFMSWTNDLNTSLEKFSQNQDYPEVVLRRLENEFCTEVDSKHGEYNWLLNTAELLSKYESQSEAEPISGKINKVMDAWKKVDDNTKGEVEKVKHIIKESATLRTSIKDIIIWIQELSFTLNTIIFFERFDETALNEKIQEHEALQKKIDEREKEVSDVLQRCEIFVMDCEHCNVSLDVRSFIVRYDSLDKNWTSLRMECAQCKDNIFVVWKMIQEVLSLCRSEDPWLIEQHEILTKIQSQCDKVPFSEINNLAAKLNSISVAIINHSTQFKLLEQSYAELLSKNHIRNLSLVQETLDRYSALKKFVMRLNGKIEKDSLKWKEFSNSHGNLILKLSQLDAKLTQIQHLDDSKVGDVEDGNKAKLEKLLALEKEFELYNEPITSTNEMAEELMSNKKRPDGKSIQEMMNEYLVMYKDIKKRIKTLKQFYRKTRSVKSQENTSEEVQVQTLKFEQDFAAQVDTLPTSMQRKDAFYYELQSTKKESQDNIERLIEVSNEDPISEETTNAIACCQSSVDLMKHLSAVLIGQCGMLSDEAVLVEVDQLVNKYQSLLSEIRFKQQHRQQQQIENNSELGRLRCPLCSQRNWSQLDNDIWRLEKWLEHAQGTLQANPATPPHNIEQLEDVIQEHKEFMVYLDSHRDVIVSLNIVGKHLMEHSENEEQSVVLQDRLVRVNEKWEKVCTQSLAWQHKLQAALMENEEFHNIIEELLNWIEETENSIKSCEPVDLTEETSVIKEKYNKFKKLHKALKRCEPRVASLQAANQVCITQQTNELETSQHKLDHLRLRLQSLIRLTWLYMLKLGSVLGYDVKNLYSGMDLSTTSTMTLSQEFLDEHAIEPMDRADTPESTTSNEDEPRSILSRGNRFFGRVIRASLPIQAFIFVMLGVVTLFPRVDDEYTCSTANNMAWSLEPMLRYPDGPPPT